MQTIVTLKKQNIFDQKSKAQFLNEIGHIKLDKPVFKPKTSLQCRNGNN
jgi:hypothetical protein